MLLNLCGIKRRYLETKLIVWFLARRRLNTGGYLRNLGIIPIENAGCTFCGVKVELVSHLFLPVLKAGKYGEQCFGGGASTQYYIMIPVLTWLAREV